MNLGISEFTFGFAFLFEQTHRKWEDLQACPVLPSLIQEAGEGWDAKLPTTGTVYYYQFKLSDYLFNWNAKYIDDGTYGDPYFRISLHRRNRNEQHRRLWELSKKQPNTFYVAPEMTGTDEFNAAFLARQMTDNSRLIPLNKCTCITDSRQHYITFQPSNPGFHEHSKPRYHRESWKGREIESLYKDDRQNWRSVDKEFAELQWKDAAEVVGAAMKRAPKVEQNKMRSLLNFDPSNVRPSKSLLQTAQLLSVFAGVTPLIVGQKE